MPRLAATDPVASSVLSATAVTGAAKPTIVLVHGAFADAASWNGVVTNLQKDGYRTVSVANWKPSARPRN